MWFVVCCLLTADDHDSVITVNVFTNTLTATLDTKDGLFEIMTGDDGYLVSAFITTSPSPIFSQAMFSLASSIYWPLSLVRFVRYSPYGLDHIPVI